MLPNVNALLDDELVGSLQTGTLDKGDIIRRLAQTIPLGQVGRGVGIRWEDPVIPRYNGQRMQSVMCSPAPGVETEAARKLLPNRSKTFRCRPAIRYAGMVKKGPVTRRCTGFSNRSRWP